MNKTNIAKTLVAVLVSASLLGGIAIAEDTTTPTVPSDSTGSKIGRSVQKVGGYIDDSAVTAKVKAALINNSAIKSADISVNTQEGVVTLSGFIPSQDQAERVVAEVRKVEGVQSVSDKLQVKDSTKASISGYAGDAAITSEIKAKLLADDIVPSRNVKVETSDGVVQLSGTVKSQAQAERAESIAKAIDGVKSVKNDLVVKS
ncbi:molecular chaperone OsmY [Erwinia endophytica]|uniref:molecular chaperone OsmY n=1 Tax=Erwinia endophytica TaxID=1563158 RepID=UPI001265E297|nr:molecular chaperone OsmY [Erwinia endophytica]KAB8306100.1 molecular chaperone OsmY [Erwinia endophytica]